MAEAPEVDPANSASYSSDYSADEFFIAGVKLDWIGELPSNTHLVRAGEASCGGASIEELNALTGSEGNSRRIAEYATVTYCPKP